MTKTWVIADTHFGHENICLFKRDDGTPLRSFSSAKEMDEKIIGNWNSVVKNEDRVYVLGDLCMARRHIATIARCVGRKILIKGNHDVFKLEEYTPYFDDIRAYSILGRTLLLSHIPVHSESIGRWKMNVHGHTHDRSLKDSRYRCVSVEQTNYYPIDLDTILKEIK